MGIRGANQILPARTRQFRLNRQAELHIGKPIDASRFDLDHKDALITEVYQAIQDLLG
jgi:1-acyl-sn-glycerol-3-phosphate acyltransferase